MSHVISFYLEELLMLAKLEHGTISLCSNKKSWNECISFDCGMIILWYNTEDNSSHIQHMIVDPDVPSAVVAWEPDPKVRVKGKDECYDMAVMHMGIC